MKRGMLLSLILLFDAGAVLAQPMAPEGRVETLLHEPGRRQVLRTTAGGSVTVLLAAEEAIRQVRLDDTRAFRVSVAPRGEQMTVQALRPAPDTAMVVESNQRTYNFLVQVGPDNDPSYSVRFATLPPPQSLMVPPGPQPAPASVSSYRLKGAKALRPKLVHEDGSKTYIEWEEDQALPAVFSLNSAGDEETVDSYMRGGVLTIDRVHDRLIFRLGRASASAERTLPKPRGRR